MEHTPPMEESAQRRRDLPTTFPRLGPMMLEIYQEILTLEFACSHSHGAASCSGWSNGTKSVFLRGLVPFNQLQQGWPCPVLGGTEEIRLWLKLQLNAALKKTTPILSYTHMFPGREEKGALGSKVSNIFTLDTQN